MEQRQLGRSGIAVPPIVFGGNIFGWTADEAASHRLLDRLVEVGLNAIDTADVYSYWVPGHQGGESEAIIGSWLAKRGNRDKVKIFTKVGMRMGNGRSGLSRAWIEEEIDASLKRLNTDHVDLYQAHKDDPDTPLEETLETFARLIKAGKVRAIGASNYSAPRLAEALAVSAKLGLPRYETLQPLYNLMDRAEFEAGLGPLCEKEQIGVINYYALASGFLSGKYRSEADFGKSKRGAGMAKYLTPRGHKVLDALDAVARARGATPAQVAVAWLLAKPAVTAPIASATSEAQIDDLVKAASLKLGAAEVAALDAASA
ncbi:aldo/keto reductase [Siccirubricoccus sp. KC 17139]|uniref:Aldo/keto reductase n=1 Tax=Siccirubricoccus soli TaxID=2899147 RepID=A0ABT1D5X5_9PROT|nr:aldo/keto reductase [Siccirubricoccus soli]MCO6416400.1 aldo/keto reductase [Siccirubricoccus soli]MCP2682534.1 aldo/keto reductase [Siccirubricoccus soli]